VAADHTRRPAVAATGQALPAWSPARPIPQESTGSPLRQAAHRHKPLEAPTYFTSTSAGACGQVATAAVAAGGDADRYQAKARELAGHCAAAASPSPLHQLRHAHATELVNDGASLATIRRSLGHENLQTIARYAFSPMPPLTRSCVPGVAVWRPAPRLSRTWRLTRLPGGAVRCRDRGAAGCRLTGVRSRFTG
jgi:Phage integrase family